MLKGLDVESVDLVEELLDFVFVTFLYELADLLFDEGFGSKISLGFVRVLVGDVLLDLAGYRETVFAHNNYNKAFNQLN